MTETTKSGAGRRLAARLGVLAAALVLAACGGGGGGGGGGSVPSNQLIADGTGSTTGVVGQPVGQVPGVRVVDGSGAGVAGIAVTFQVGQPGASVSPATVTTGADGRARPSSWVLGTQPAPTPSWPPPRALSARSASPPRRPPARRRPSPRPAC